MNSLLFARFKQWLSGSVARGAVVATIWQAVRVAGQALWTISLARSLGPVGYGGFAGAAGLATAVGSLSGLGFGLVMLQDASRDASEFSRAWRRAVVAVFASGSVFLLAFIMVAPRFLGLPGPSWQYVAIGIAELLCFPLTVLASYAFQARERMGFAGAMYTLVPLSNLSAVAFYAAMGGTRSLSGYLPWHALSSILAAGAGIAFVVILLRPGPSHFSITRRDAAEAAGFSLMRVVDNGLGSLDKTLVLRLAGAEAAGIYTAAFRLVAVLALPVTSMAMAALPRLFRLGDLTRPHGQTFIRRLTMFGLVGGGVASLAVLALSLVLPLLLGTSFQASAGFARWLCLFPLLFGLSSLGCNILMAAHFRRLRIAAQLMGLLTLVAAMYLLVPPFGLPGAAAALLTAHAVIVIAVWTAVSRAGTRVTS
jgi:O-antigen/teichoic acid export membrane protein